MTFVGFDVYLNMTAYLLQATGTDWLTCGSIRTVTNTCAFLTEEKAEEVAVRFRQACIDKHLLLDDSTLKIQTLVLTIVE